jgi:Leucine-rich repeat (LRR) protein
MLILKIELKLFKNNDNKNNDKMALSLKKSSKIEFIGTNQRIYSFTIIHYPYYTDEKKQDFEYYLLKVEKDEKITISNIYCQNNYFRTITNLKSGLTYLDCSKNLITELSYLPETLEYLNCSYNKLKTLNLFNDSHINLKYLDCSHNKIIEINHLPKTLTELDISYNKIVIIPELGNNLIKFNCGFNKINFISEILPPNLKILCVNYNRLEKIFIHKNIQYLDCSYNLILILDFEENSSLKFLYCQSNMLKKLVLPDSIKYLECQSNQLEMISSFPKSLVELDCSENNLLYLPPFPSSLTKINCSYNLLDELNQIPNNCTQLNCRMNYLKFLPPIPKKLLESDNLKCHLNEYIDPKTHKFEGYSGIKEFNLEEFRSFVYYFQFRYSYNKLNIPPHIPQELYENPEKKITINCSLHTNPHKRIHTNDVLNQIINSDFSKLSHQCSKCNSLYFDIFPYIEFIYIHQELCPVQHFYCLKCRSKTK